MRYVSTRGTAPELGFADVLLSGLASDGGLYVPTEWPTLPAAGDDYSSTATSIMATYIGDEISAEVLEAIVRDAYAAFRHPEVAPLVQIEDDLWIQELFHGPTLAFKDLALQVVGRLFDHVLAERSDRVTIVGATSGDTGSAAIDAVKSCDNVDIVILYPRGRTSDVQRRQMTTVDSPNVHAVAVDGTFDDCQDLVKAMFADEQLRRDCNLSAVNSINWARVMAQIVYYVTASQAFAEPATFCVPTGNFGDIFAGYVAKRMGLPIARLIVATNANDILARFIESGDYRKAEVIPTLSPSMDIQVSSNFERFLFDLYDRDGAAVTDVLTQAGVPADRQAAYWQAVRGNIAKRAEAGLWWPVFTGEATPIVAEEDRAFLEEALTLLPDPPYAADTWSTWTTAVKEATGRKGKALFMPLRLALTGQASGPNMGDLMPLLQKIPGRG